jgi:hypothetical protein
MAEVASTAGIPIFSEHVRRASGERRPPLARILPDCQGRVAAQARCGPPRPQPGRPTRTDPHPPALGEGQRVHAHPDSY